MSDQLADHEMTEVVQSSERPFDGRLIHVRVDTVRLPNGNSSKREIVEHPGAVAMVPLLDEHTVLLVRQYRHAAGGPLWEIPAGTLEPGEDPLACAHRELEEEAGLRAGRMEKIYEIFVAPGYTTELIHGYVAQDLTAAKRQTDADEFLRAEPMKFEEAIRMIERMEIRDAKTICGILCVARTRGGS